MSGGSKLTAHSPWMQPRGPQPPSCPSSLLSRQYQGQKGQSRLMVGVEGNEEIVDDNDDRAMKGNEGITATPTSDPLCTRFCWRSSLLVLFRVKSTYNFLRPQPLHRPSPWSTVAVWCHGAFGIGSQRPCFTMFYHVLPCFKTVYFCRCHFYLFSGLMMCLDLSEPDNIIIFMLCIYYE